MSKHILSVSYDESLLATRQLLLAYRGYSVISALGFTDAIEQCKTSNFDLFILGHSVPISDKNELIRTFRQYCSAPILSLDRAGESRVDSDFHVAPNDPEQFLKKVAEVVAAWTRSVTRQQH